MSKDACRNTEKRFRMPVKVILNGECPQRPGQQVRDCDITKRMPLNVSISRTHPKRKLAATSPFSHGPCDTLK
eukprot:4687854-Pleurochrysis_carterae.AAC.1